GHASSRSRLSLLTTPPQDPESTCPSPSKRLSRGDCGGSKPGRLPCKQGRSPSPLQVQRLDRPLPSEGESYAVRIRRTAAGNLREWSGFAGATTQCLTPACGRNRCRHIPRVAQKCFCEIRTVARSG